MTVELLNKNAILVSIDSVQPHPANPNIGNVELISESMEETGMFGGIVVQQSTSFILVGNHRWMAAKEAGLEELPAFMVDVDDKTAMRILLADNEIARKASWDDAKLLEELTMFEKEDFKGTGFSREQYEGIQDRVGTNRISIDADADFAFNQKAVDLQGDLLREGQAMREIVLALPKADADVFASNVEKLMKHWGTNAVRDIVQRAVQTCADAIPQEQPASDDIVI